ncbi:MAG: TrbG/VirB9 family P-type conjugative transfer protein, partial [Trebonia sp.]
MKVVRLFPMAVLGLSACAAQGPRLASCKGPVWSANPAAPTPVVWDNGRETFFRFPGNMRIPSFFVVNPDGREAVADYTVNSLTHIVTVHQTAPEFRLRDGHSVLCLTNHHYDPVGTSTHTGTTRPDIVRVLKA